MPAALRPTASGNASVPTSPHASPLLASLPIPLLPSSSATSPATPQSAPNSPNSKTNPPPMPLKTSSPHHAPFLSHLTDERTRRRTRESAGPPLPPAPSAGRLTTLRMSVQLRLPPLTPSALPPLYPSMSPLSRTLSKPTPPLRSSSSPSGRLPLNCSTPQRALLPPQSSTWTTSAPCVVMWAIFALTAQGTSRPERVAAPVTRLGITLLLAPRTATVGTATHGDIVATPARTPIASAKKITAARSPPVTLTTGAHAPLYRMTPGQTTTDSTTCMTTLTGRHRTALLEV